MAAGSSDGVDEDWCQASLVDDCGRPCNKPHKLMYCRDYQNTLSCTRGEICPYIHVTKTEQILYIRNANTMKPVVWREMLRTKQVGKICKRMNCSGNCGLKHFKVEEAVPLLCRICYCSLVSVEDGVVLDCCRHFFCEQCVLTLISADEYSCPLCRTRFNNYIKLKDPSE